MTELPEYFTTAELIKDSISYHTGQRIQTYELEYPRYIHAEILTHRVFSKNSQSSRAVPVKHVLEVNRQNPVLPIVWGKNKGGMSSTKVLTDNERFIAEGIWRAAASHAFTYSEELLDTGLHKQWSNRISEPFSRIKVVLTATEYDNFDWLRDDLDGAQPEIVDLARKMKQASQKSKPVELSYGEYHLPYVNSYRNSEGKLIYLDESNEVISLDQALRTSASCCAQVSYRKLDTTLEKADTVYKRLFEGSRPHLSPTEHQATPIENWAFSKGMWDKGITHQDRQGSYWSANFKNWIQYRQIL